MLAIFMGNLRVEFGGQKFKNIYDYTCALHAVKIGKPVEIVLRHGAETLKLTVTPEAGK